MGEFMSQLTEAIASIGEARARSMQVRDAEVAR